VTDPIDVSAIVLAGGRSSRFGSSKLDADLAGRTVLDRTIEAVAAVSSEVIVVGRSMAAGSCSRTDVRFVGDPAPFEGPLVGLIEGLRQATHEIVIALGGDMPLARPTVLARMIDDLAASEDIEGIVLEQNGDHRPLPSALRRRMAFPAAEAANSAGERSLRQLVARLRVEALRELRWRELDPSADTLFDIDSPADLEEARARARR
jgi:molybdopterin-guanine dinucleotide biosynthesis protein A